MQNLIVAIIILAAIWTVVRRYAPLAWKSAFSGMLIQVASRLDLEKLAKKMEAKRSEAPSCASGCSTCGGCSLSGKTPASEYVVLIENLKSRKPGPASDQGTPRFSR